jgi:proteasome assembly chaperone (PAC2) family protein
MKLSMIAAILVVAGSAQAQSLTEKYELSERCGKQAEERYAKEVESVSW